MCAEHTVCSSRACPFKPKKEKTCKLAIFADNDRLPAALAPM